MQGKNLQNRISAKASDAGKRADVFLFEAGAYDSRNAAAKALANSEVLIGGKPVKKNYVLRAGDVFECQTSFNKIEDKLAPNKFSLNKVFEDDYILIISKPAGLMTHPANPTQTTSVMNALIYDYGTGGLCKCQGNEKRPGIVHRLDAFTSGLMVCAKTDEAGYALIDAISKKQVDRRYLCLAHGVIEEEKLKIVAPLRRHATHRTKMVVGGGQGSKEAITIVSPLMTFSAKNNIDAGYTLAECKLETGRTHQIRAHLQHIKHPLVADPLYNSFAPKAKAASLGLTRQFLHSYYINLTHPITGENIEIFDPLADDLTAALGILQERVASVSNLFESKGDSLKRCLGGFF